MNKLPMKSNKRKTVTNLFISLTRLRRIMNIVIIGFVQLWLVQLAMLLTKGCGGENYESMAHANADTLRQVRNELNQQVTTTSLLMGERKELLRINAGSDSVLRELQQLVRKQHDVLSATVLHTQTIHQGSAETTVLPPRDTTSTDSLRYPVYKTQYSDQWRELSIVADRDSISWQIKDFNEFEIVQKYERQGWLKPKRPVIEVTNLNPYTETRNLKTFTVKPPKQRRGLMFVLGAVAGAVTIGILNK